MKDAALALCLLAWPVLAASEAGTVVYVPARPVQATEPKLVPAAGGWVHVTYMVQIDGSVGDVMVLDSSGSEALEKSVVEAISTWKYQPATVNGQPVPQRLDDRIAMIKWSQDTAAMRRQFKKIFKQARKLIAERKFDAAEIELIRARDENALSYQSWASIHELLSYVYAGRGDKPRQMENLLAALAYGGFTFNSLEMEVMLRTLIGLEIDMRMYRSALATYRLLGLTDDADKQAMQALTAFVTGTEGFRVEGKIEKRGASSANASWNYDILRRRIAFADVDGAVDRFEVRCANHIFSEKVNVEQEWTLPDSWGNCTLLVFGQPGSRFKLLELPSLPQ